MRKTAVSILIVTSLLSTFTFAAKKYTYLDLVNKLTDLESLAVLPQPGEKCAQFSSYDRSSKYDPQTGQYIDWQANEDWTGYVRKEGENYVLAEMDGPGVIWRIWSAKTGEGNVKVFLDGNTEPAIDMPFSDFFSGQKPPFNRSELVYTAAMGLNCYIPIPYQKSCKIIADKNWPYKVLPDLDPGVFFHFTYTTYPEGTELPTFSMNLSESENSALDRVNNKLANTGSKPADIQPGRITQIRTITVQPGQAIDVFDLKGPRAVTSLKVVPHFDIPGDDHDTLRLLTMSINWDNDDRPAVWSPLGDFFGTAPGENHYKSLPMGMTDHEYYSFWYMPFSERAVIKITNDSDTPRKLTLKASHAPLEMPVEKLGRFHAKWHRDAFLPPQQQRPIDWTMLKTTGTGRYCGVMLHVWHPRGGWWGEGDEKIYIDAEPFPSTFGTGSEDYFGYAWCIPSLFRKGFHNQTHSNQPPDAKVDPHEGNRGHVSVNRWHIADNMPFQASFEATIEKYCSNNFPTLYAAVAYWYQAPGGSDPYPVVPPELRVGYWKPLEPPYKVKNAIEAEKMQVVSRSAGNASPQGMIDFDGKWSNETQLWWTGAAPGDQLELGFEIDKSGTYELTLGLTKAADYGIVELYLDGDKIAGPIDLYNDGVVPLEYVHPQTLELEPGRHILKFKITGANEKAVRSYMVGIDYLKLEPVKGVSGAGVKKKLYDLRNRQILVPMWGWPVEEMAQAAKKFGYEVVNSPHGNDMEKIKKEVEIWSRHGLKMIARPAIEVADPFDPQDVQEGIEKLNALIGYYDTQQHVVAVVITWGLFGEGGFPWDYKFTEKARQSFNEYMNTPGLALPQPPEVGKPGSMRWLKWLEYRQHTLVNFRKKFLASAKKHTDKLVGTWSEVYPTEHYTLNMGDAPGADFMFYDLSFGDVTCNQRIAFGESHGDMQHFKTFEAWRDHELPLMAKAAGEGVIPIAFQFPMRRGHAVDFLSETTVFTDTIEQEYSLRIGPDIRRLVNAANKPIPQPQVALVYQSFAAAALPGGGESDIPGSIMPLPFYQNISTKQIEGLMHQMGIDMQVIPYRWLEDKDLSSFKAVIIPDPVYLNDKMKSNLQNANRLLLCGEYMLAHRQPEMSKGNYLDGAGFASLTFTPERKIIYKKLPAGKLEIETPAHEWLKDISIPDTQTYPCDQYFIFDPMPKDARTLLTLAGTPVIISTQDGQRTYITNRLLNHAWQSDSPWLENLLYAFLRNYLEDAGVRINITTPPLARVNLSRFYGSYGLSGNIAWNTLDRDLEIQTADGKTVTVPAFNWTLVNRQKR